MFNLDELDEFVTDKKRVPSTVETIQFCFWERGISLQQFNELPIPYIISMLNTFNYFEEMKSKSLEKNK